MEFKYCTNSYGIRRLILSFRKIPKCHTTLSSHIWKLKDKNIPYKVKWSIKTRGHAFSNGGHACDLCLTEKLVILTADQNTTLNRRDELLETCRHQRKHLLISLFKKEKPPATTIKQRGVTKHFFTNTYPQKPSNTAKI